MDGKDRAPSRAALHEAGHELVALVYGCRDVFTVLHSRESGVCRHRLPPTQRWDEDVGIWLRDDLGRVRARAAVAMAGGMAEALSGARPVPGYEELLLLEAEDPVFSDSRFTYAALEETFNHATYVFGNHNDAAAWLKAALPAVHANTRAILEENWPRLLQRARELDETLERPR